MGSQRKRGRAERTDTDTNTTDPDWFLLVWPSSVTSEANGFLVGWSNEGSMDPQWPAKTVVAAGVLDALEDDSSENLSQSYNNNVQRRFHTLLQRIQKDFCSCQDETKCITGLDIIGYASSERLEHKHKQWLQAKQLLHISFRDGYPTVENLKGADNLRQQILMYDHNKLYRHDMCSSGSSFSQILTKCSVSGRILNCLHQDHKMPTIGVGKTQQKSTTKASHSLTDDQKENVYESTVKILLDFIARHSLLVHHFRSRYSHQTHDGIFPIRRIFHSYRSLYGREQMNERHCKHCDKRQLVPDNIQQEERINHLLQSAVDVVVGLFLGALLLWSWHHRDRPLMTTILSYYIDQRILQDWLQWLESFPIGFKLNVPFTQTIGREIWSLALLHQRFIDVISSKAVPMLKLIHYAFWLYTIGIVLLCGVLGGTALLALIMDLTRAMTWHLALLDRGFRFLYRNETYLLATLSKLFRGKKRNILRHRTDTMAYDSMQLLLGSLLFAVTLFLLTTILVYYVFFTLLNLAVRTSLSLVIWIVYTFLQDFPFGRCYLRLRNPELFVSQVFLDEVIDGTAPSWTVVKLLTTYQSIGAIITSDHTLEQRAKSLRSWLGASFGEIISGTSHPESLVSRLNK